MKSLLCFMILLKLGLGNRTYWFSIDKNLNGSAITHNATVISLTNTNGSDLNIHLEGEIFEIPTEPNDCRNGFGHLDLLDYEVTVLFFLDPSSMNYLQVALAPCGGHLVVFTNVTSQMVDLLQIEYASNITEDVWSGEAVVPANYLPANVTRFNAFQIHVSKQGDKIIETLFPPMIPLLEFPYLDSFGDVPPGLDLTNPEMSEQWNAAMEGKLILNVVKTTEGIEVNDPIKIFLSKDADANETILTFSKNLLSSYSNGTELELSVFFENDQDMALRLDLTSDEIYSKATFLWGPSGSWSSEEHSFNSSDDSFLGGTYTSNFSANLWEAEARFPWSFLPPNMTEIQALETMENSVEARALYPAAPSSAELPDLMNFSHPIDTNILVDEDFNKAKSPIWENVTLSAVLYVAVIIISGVAVFAGVTSYAEVSGKASCDGCACCFDSCSVEGSGSGDAGDLVPHGPINRDSV